MVQAILAISPLIIMFSLVSFCENNRGENFKEKVSIFFISILVALRIIFTIAIWIGVIILIWNVLFIKI